MSSLPSTRSSRTVGDRSGPCAVCGADATLRCSRCHRELYCGKECQRAAWPAHKAAACGAAAAAAARARARVEVSAHEEAGAVRCGDSACGGGGVHGDVAPTAATATSTLMCAASGHKVTDPSCSHDSASAGVVCVVPEVPQCIVCGARAMLRCGWCRKVMYCGSKCERAARGAHTGMCAAATGAATSAGSCHVSAGPCESCGGAATLCCARCQLALYCGAGCLRASGAVHSQECNSTLPSDGRGHVRAITGEGAAAVREVKGWIADLCATDLWRKQVACAAILKYASMRAENAAIVAALGGIPRLVSAARSDYALHGPAAAALRVMSSDYSNQATIAIAGGIPLMIELLHSVPSVYGHAALALSSLSRKFENRATIASAGAIPIIIKLMASATANIAVRCSAAATLGNLGYDAVIAAQIDESGGVAPLISMLRSRSIDEVQAGSDAVLRLSTHAQLRRSIVAGRGIIPLVALLDTAAPHTNLQVQQNAASVLTQLSNNPELVAAGAVPLLMGHLTSPSVLLQVAAASALQNVCVWADNYVAEGSLPNLPFCVQIGGARGFLYRVESEVVGEIPRLIMLLGPGAPPAVDAQLAALDALRRLSAASTRIKAHISSKALPLLTELLTAPSEIARELAAAAMCGLDLVQLSKQDALAAIPRLIAMTQPGRINRAAATLMALAARRTHVGDIAAAAGQQFDLLVQVSMCSSAAAGTFPSYNLREQRLSPTDAAKAACALPILVELLSSPFEVVQQNAVTQLHSILVVHRAFVEAAADAVAPLLKLLASASDMAVRDRTESVLRLLLSTDALVGAIAAVADTRVLVKLSCSTAAFPAVDKFELLNSADVSDLGWAARALPILTELLASPFEVVQHRTAVQLRIILVVHRDLATAAAGAVPRLLKLISSRSTRVQEIAAAALCNLNVPASWSNDAIAAIPSLIAMMQTRWISVRERAAAILRKFMSTDELVDVVHDAAAGATLQGLKILLQLSCSDTADGTVAFEMMNGSRNAWVVGSAARAPSLFAELVASPFVAVQRIASHIVRGLAQARRHWARRLASTIPVLLTLLKSSVVDVQRSAADALAAIGAIKSNAEIIMASATSDALLVLMGSQSTRTQVFAAILLYYRIAHGAEKGTAAAAEASIPVFVSLLALPNAQIQGMLTDALLSMSVSEDARSVIAASEGIPALIAMLTSGAPGTQGRAAIILSRLSEIEECADQIAAAGGIPPLIALLSSADAQLQDIAAFVVNTLTDNENCAVAIAAEGGIPSLIALLRSSSMGAQEEAACALKALSEDTETAVDIGTAGGVRPLLDLLSSPSARARADAEIALYNVVGALTGASAMVALALFGVRLCQSCHHAG